MSEQVIVEAIERERPWLTALVNRTAGTALARLESIEDLVQGVSLRALELSGEFEWRGLAPFRAWLERLTAQHLSSRRRHWVALRRGGGRLLRRQGGDSTFGTMSALAASQSGPSTFASRREEIEMAARALSLLPPTDREWVESWLDDEPLEDAANARGQTYAAAQRARARALERLKQVFQLVQRAQGT